MDAEYIVHYNRPTLGGVDKATVRNVAFCQSLNIQKCLSSYVFQRLYFHSMLLIWNVSPILYALKLRLICDLQVSSQEKDHRVDVSYYLAMVVN